DGDRVLDRLHVRGPVRQPPGPGNALLHRPHRGRRGEALDRPRRARGRAPGRVDGPGRPSAGRRHSRTPRRLPDTESMKPAIRIDNLSKQYRLGTRSFANYRDLREVLANVAAAPLHRFFGRNGQAQASAPGILWALKDVSFDVQPGEVVGII